MRVLLWLAIRRSGVVARVGSPVSSALASMRSVCHSASLKMRISPRSSSLMRVSRRSPVCHRGVLLWMMMREICEEQGVNSVYIQNGETSFSTFNLILLLLGGGGGACPEGAQEHWGISPCTRKNNIRKKSLDRPHRVEGRKFV